MAMYLCTTILCLLAAIASAQDLVVCYQRDGCSSSGLVFDGVTIQDCCDNINGGGLGGIGLGASYQQDGIEVCLICPVVLGFIPSEFSAIERGEAYSVQAGFLSGRPPQGGNLNLNLVLGTAGPGDVTASHRVQPRATKPIRTFQITLTVDGISQEFTETFSIELVGFGVDDIFLFPVGVTPTVNNLTGTIIDQDKVEFSLSEDDFRENEAPFAMMEFEIAKDGILANPVLFRVTPLTVTDAERLNILKFTRPDDDDVSPSVADTNDFNDTAFNVIFPADENLIMNIADVEEFIPIVDDEIDEAQEQVFIILLEVLDAVNFDLITITRSTSLGRIVDNDRIQIGFALPEYSFHEPEFETIVNDIVLVREGGRLSEQTFQVSISVGGTFNINPATLEFVDEDAADYRLTAPQDFIALDFPPDRQNITLSVILFPDDLPEGTEAFQAISTPSQNFPNFGRPSMGGAFANTDVLIIDDDLAVVGFVQLNYTFSESVGSGEVSVQVFNPLQNQDLLFDIELVIQPRIGTAGGSDFFDRTIPAVTISSSIAIGDGTPREATASVSIYGDSFFEDVESFELILLLDPGVSQSGVIVDPSVTTVNIIDDDDVVIDFNDAPYEVNETDGVANVTIGVVSGQLMREVVVELSFSDGTAIDGSDYVAIGPFTLTFNSTIKQFTFEVPVIDDDKFEITESLTISLNFPGGIALPRASIPQPSTQMICLDNDLLVFEFIPDVYKVREGAGAVDLSISLAEGDVGEFTIVLTTVTDDNNTIATAIVGSDYQSVQAAELTYSKSSSRNQTFPVTILSDDTTELREFFVAVITGNFVLRDGGGAQLSLSQQESSRIQVWIPEAQVFIVDINEITIGFVPAEHFVNESTGFATLFLEIIIGTPSVDVVVQFSTEGGSAQGSQNFNETVRLLTFAPGERRISVMVPMIDDDLVEGDEVFFGVISLPPGSASIIEFSPQRVNVTISDNDAARIGFLQDYEVMEGVSNTVSVEIGLLDGALGRNVEVLVFTFNDSALAPGDYAESMEIFTFSPTESRFAITILINNDDILERTEQFFARAQLVSSDAPGGIIMPDESVITILDEDVVVIGFQPDQYTVDEDAGSVNFTVLVIDGQLGSDVVVVFFTEDGSAQAPDDYANSVIPLTFGPTRTSQEVSVPIVDDDLLEDIETFFGNLRFAEVFDSIQFAPSRANASISVVLLGWEFPVYNTSEDVNTMEICAVLLGNATLDDILIFNLLAEDGTATAGQDYNIPLTFEFLPGGTTRMCTMAHIIDDDLLEDSLEYFEAVLTLNSTEQVTVIPERTRVQIFDNDQLVISLNKSEQLQVLEDAPSTEACISFSTAFAIDFNISVKPSMPGNVTIPGFATPRMDYTAPPPLLMAQAMVNGPDNPLCFEVPIVNDTFVELEECFNVSINLGSDTTNLMLSIADGQDSTLCCIQDNDRITIGFDRSEYNVNEPDGTLTISASILDGTLMRPAEVMFSTTDGTATSTALDFFKLDAMVLLFDENTLNHSINITIFPDATLEDLEYFFGNLITSDDAVDLLPNTTRINILEINDGMTTGGLSSGMTTGGLSSGTIIAISVVSAVAILILVVSILVVVVICVKKSTREEIPSAADFSENELSTLMVRKTYRMNVPKKLIIYSCNLQLKESVGQGEFGIVYKARLSKGFNKSFTEVVAVKTLKGFLEPSVVRDLMKECTLMATFDHPNVLTLIGVCVDGGPSPFIVMPFMFNGSLLAHLKKERENLVIPPDQQMDSVTIGASTKLMDMCLQISKGMEYLASKKLIHRDLAARNCMIDMDYTVKVADFGLSKGTGNYKDYFRQDKTEGTKLPVKWLAPESLSDGVFSEKSDVWAFGVTCWEMFTGGKVPYAGIDPSELLRRLENGYRMEMPNNSACIDEMSKLMVQCWAAKAEDRPTFCGIVTSLSQSLDMVSGYMELHKAEEETVI